MIHGRSRAYRPYAVAGILAVLACITWFVLLSIRVNESPEARALFSLFGAKSERDLTAPTNSHHSPPQLGFDDPVQLPNADIRPYPQQAGTHSDGSAGKGKSLSQGCLEENMYANNTLRHPTTPSSPIACPTQAKPFSTSLSNQVLDECMIQPPENSSITVCFVHVGNDIDHGMHTFFAIAQLRRTNPNANIVWILSKKVAEIPSVKAIAECYVVNIVVSEDLEEHPSTSNEFRAFRY